MDPLFSWERRDGAGVLDLKVRLELMFFGEFYHTLDEKGRLTIPADYRKLLAGEDGAMLMRGLEKNLILISAESFLKLNQSMNQLSITDPSARLLRRVFFSGAAKVAFDKIGRILVPQYLRSYAVIENEVVIAGVGNYVEIWSPEFWADQQAQFNDPSVTASRFIGFNLTSL